jgi:multiple antibiotic resistance protein
VDLAYVFTLCFATLGPLKTVPPFFLATQGADRRAVLALAAKSTVMATGIVLFVDLVVAGTMARWRVSLDALAVAGGLVLLATSIKTLSSFQLVEPRVKPAGGEAEAAPVSPRWLGRPVLSPLVIPGILPPVGVVVVLFFAGIAASDAAFHARWVGLLLAIMVTNFVAMLLAGPIMRRVGLPVLQVVGWVFSALQAGLAVQILIDSLRHLGLHSLGVMP